jgi:chemotaxis protein MotB
MADETCPLCEGKGAGLPGYFGTMADMFTLLFAFFVLMFSMATMDPAQMPGDGGVEGEGAAEKEQEKIEETVEALEKQKQELKEQGITEIDDKPIEEYIDSLIQDIKEEAEPVPKKYEIHGDLAEIIEEMELDSSEATVDIKDVRGMVIELNGSICFDPGKATLKPKLLEFLDAAVDSFMSVPKDKNQIIIEGHSDNWPVSKKIAEYYPSNWELSSARAAAVVNYLINKGVNPSRLVAHGYADRWPADMSWMDMRRGYQLRPVGDNVEVVIGRGGQPEYSGVELDENDVPKFDKISMDSVIDSLNSTRELRAKNRRIKIIFTKQQFVDGLDMKPIEDVGRK